MNQSQLETVVVYPEKFAKLFQDISNEKALTPVASRLLKNPTNDRYDAFRLIAGGRFLLAYTDSTIELWDIGASSEQLPDSPLASISIDGLDNEEVYVQPTQDGLGLWVVTVIQEEDSEDEFTTNFYAYEVYPDSPNPQFLPISSLKYPASEENCYWAIPPRLFHHVIISSRESGQTLFWDVNNHMWGEMVLPLTDDRIGFFVRDNCLYVLQPGQMDVFTLPQLLDCESPILDSPTFLLTSLTYEQNTTGAISFEDSWWTPIQGPVIDVIMEDNPSGDYYTHSFKIQSPPSAKSDIRKVPPTLTYHTRSLGLLWKTEESAVYSFMRFAENELLIWVTRDDLTGKYEIKSTITSFPAIDPESPSKLTTNRTGVLIQQLDEFPKFEYCPMRGRFCVLVAEGIRILDFVE